jgi:hypothetical protein
MNTPELERFLARLIAQFRREEIAPLRARLDALECDLATERRLADIEARVGGGDTIAARVMRGAPVDTRQWMQFVRQLQQ